MIITIRKFEREDIPRKVEWINNPANNQYLHYDIPIEVGRTLKWFDSTIGRSDRYDAVIEADGIPCGTIGLLSIDRKNSKAEFYIAMGEPTLKGKGIATEACRQILDFGFNGLELNRIYLYTETENIPAQSLFEKAGFVKEGCLREDIFSHGRFVDRYVYGISRNDYLKKEKLLITGE